MRIIFVRHGEPDYSTDSLTEKGKKDAEILAKRVKNWNIKDIYVSPMGRAKETARPTLEALKREAIEMPWLREFSYKITSPVSGKQGVPWDFVPSFLYSDKRFVSGEEWINVPPICDNEDIVKNFPLVKEGIDNIIEKYGYKRTGNYYTRMDGRERYLKSTVMDSKYATVDSFPENDSEPNIVIFCHLGVICLMMSHILNIPFELLTHGFFIPTTSLTILNTEERWGTEVSFRVQAMGDVSHLLMEGESISNAGSFARAFQQ